MKEDKLTDWRSNAKKRRIRSLIAQQLLQIFEIYEDRGTAAHMVNILRSKGKVVGFNKDGSAKYRDPYYMQDEETLKLIENYREELDLIALESAQEDKDGD